MEFVNNEIDSIMKDYPFFEFTFPSKEILDQIKQINYYTEDEKSKEKYYDGIDAIRKYVGKGKYLPDDIKKLIKEYVDEELDEEQE